MKSAKKWIVAIDDDADDLFWMSEAIAGAAVENFAYSFSTAKNGTEGRALVESIVRERLAGEEIIVFCDVNMPGESGLQFLEWVKAQTRFANVPVIILSSFDRRADVIRAFELGAIACMFKPPQPNAVKGLLRSMTQLSARLTETQELDPTLVDRPAVASFV